MANETTTASLKDSVSAEQLYADIFDRSMVVVRAQSVMPNLARYFGDRIGVEARIASERNQVAAASVQEGTPIPLTEKTKKQIASLTPSEAGAAVSISTRAARTDTTLVQDTATDLGGAIAEKIDRDLCAAFDDFTAGTVGDDATAMTIEHIEVAQAILRDGKKYGRYVAVLHERQWFAIRRSLKINQDLQNAPEFIRDELARQWFMGQLGGTGLIVTPHVPIVEGVATGGVFVADQAVALDMRQAPAYDALWKGGRERLTEYSIVADYAAGVWRPDYGVKIVTDAPAPALSGDGGEPGTGD